jgi:CelD/BcsL family acetyltransferase involved in cellulose biosynthesis
MLESSLIVDLPTLETLRPEWDALAEANALPLMAPGWIMPWWRHIAPPGAAPRVVAVREDGVLVGLAPFYVVEGSPLRRIDYRLPGIELATRLAPLSLPDREWEIAGAIAILLSEATPHPDLIALESVPPASPWLTAIREQWPGRIRPPARIYHVHDSLTISLREPSYEAWMASRSARFRERMRKLRRKFEAAGGTGRTSTRGTLSEDVATLVRLHTARWESRGASDLVSMGERIPAMFEDAGEQLMDSGRFRLMLLEIAGEPISAHLALAGGGRVVGINGGWDEQWAHLSPTVVHCLHLVEDALARGDRRIDLGVGEQAYKLRFADRNDPVGWAILAPPGRRLVATGVRTAPMLASRSLRDTAKRSLKPEQLNRLRTWRDRLHR